MFVETQGFKWYIYLLFLVLCLLFTYAFVAQVIFGQPFGQHSAPNSIVVFLWVIFSLISAFIAQLKLKTKIDAHGIAVRLYPVTSVTLFRWADIKAVSVIKYPFIGFGIRFSAKYNTMYYNTYGNIGVMLDLNDGRQIVIGTNQVEAVIAAIKLYGVEVVSLI